MTQSIYYNSQNRNIHKITTSSNTKKNNQTALKKNNFNENSQINKPKIATIAFIGAIIPVVLLNIKNGKAKQGIDIIRENSTLKKKLIGVSKILEIESYGDILATTTGGVTAGCAAGVFSTHNKKERIAKYKEGIFEFLNNMIPTTLVAILEYITRKNNIKSKTLKATGILTSVAGGMYLANKSSSVINHNIFDKDSNEIKYRKFKLGDVFVHIDDLISLLVLTKVPFAKKLQVDKILPFLYAKTGYEAGCAKEL